MANQDVRVSALQSASTLSTDDLALATVVDELSETGYTSKKITEGAKASQYLEAFTFANLNTSAKTIVGAINEAATTGGSDEFIIHMTDTTVTETAADIIDAFDGGSEIWLESQNTGETIKARLPLLAYISDSSQLVLRFSGITYANNRYRYCDVQMLRSPEQIVGRQSLNVTFAVIDDDVVASSSVWSSQKTAAELAGKAEIDDTAVSSSTAWSSSQIASLLPTESASGAVASFETPLTLPLVSHNVTIEPVQAGTGDPSPSNPRAISGWSAVNVTRTGSNLWDEEWELGSISTVDGSKSASDSTVRTKNNIYVKSNTKFSIVKVTGFPFYILFYDTNGVAIQYVQQAGDVAAYNMSAVIDANATSATFTTPNGTAYILIRFNSMTSYSGGISVNYPATDTTYHAYSGGTSVEITLGQTVYVGTLDVKNGVLTITHTQVDLGGLNWEYRGESEGVNRFSSNVVADLKLASVRTLPLMCSGLYPAILPDGAYINNSIYNYGHTDYDKYFYVATSAVSTGADLKTMLNGVMCVYPLETPVEITLTPEQINTLEGVNNVWADTGDTAIEFKQDIQTYIDSRLSSGTRSLSLAKAPVETQEETKQEEQEGDENVDR